MRGDESRWSRLIFGSTTPLTRTKNKRQIERIYTVFTSFVHKINVYRSWWAGARWKCESLASTSHWLKHVFSRPIFYCNIRNRNVSHWWWMVGRNTRKFDFHWRRTGMFVFSFLRQSESPWYGPRMQREINKNEEKRSFFLLLFLQNKRITDINHFHLTPKYHRCVHVAQK